MLILNLIYNIEARKRIVLNDYVIVSHLSFDLTLCYMDSFMYNDNSVQSNECGRCAARNVKWNGPRREKTCLRSFHQSEIQTTLLSYRDYLENWNFTRSKFTYETFQKANNKGADQTAWMRRLVCACVIRTPPPEDRFSRDEAQTINYIIYVVKGQHWGSPWQLLAPISYNC